MREAGAVGVGNVTGGSLNHLERFYDYIIVTPSPHIRSIQQSSKIVEREVPTTSPPQSMTMTISVSKDKEKTDLNINLINY